MSKFSKRSKLAVLIAGCLCLPLGCAADAPADWQMQPDSTSPEIPSDSVPSETDSSSADAPNEKSPATPALPSLAAYLQKGELQPRKETNLPMFYMDLGLFENCETDRIDVYVTSVAATDGEPYMTVRVIDTLTLEEKSSHRFYAEAVECLTPNCVLTLRCADTVRVGEGETLAFGDAGDPLVWGYKESAASAPAELRGFWCGTAYSTHQKDGVLGVDVYLKESRRTVDEEELRSILAGKKLSILGDSICTYSGWSDVGDVNTTLKGYAVSSAATKMASTVEKTWWKQTADRLGMEVLVNNAWAGTSVSNARSNRGVASYGYNTRCLNLHDNTTENNSDGKEILPDIIALYMGTNDLLADKKCAATLEDGFFEKIESEGFEPDGFEEAYALTVYKMTSRYPDAEIFCFQLPILFRAHLRVELCMRYNEIIAQIAEHYGCGTVDLFHTALSSYSANTVDGIHPRESGMQAIADAFAESLAEWFSE